MVKQNKPVLFPGNWIIRTVMPTRIWLLFARSKVSKFRLSLSVRVLSRKREGDEV